MICCTCCTNQIKSFLKLTKSISYSGYYSNPMLADAQNIVLCKNEDNKLIIKSCALEGSIDDKDVLDDIAEITDGGKSSIKKRVKKYNLKKFSE